MKCDSICKKKWVLTSHEIQLKLENLYMLFYYKKIKCDTRHSSIENYLQIKQ